MKTINKVFLILFVSLVGSPVFAPSDLSFGYRTLETEINTFVQKVEGTGELTAAVQAADGGYVTTSRIDDSSFFVRKIKASGQKQWERGLNFGVDCDYFANINGIAQTTDGGYVLAGQVGCHAEVNGGQDATGATLIKLRSNGTIVWKKWFWVPGVGYDYLFDSVSPTPDGGVIATGRRSMHEFDPSTRLLIARFNSGGVVVWEKGFGTLLDSYYGGPAFVTHSIATSDHGFIVAFRILPPNGGVEVMKITDSGDVVWQKLLSLGSFGFQSMGTAPDGGVILINTIENSKKLKVVVLKADGTLSWKAEYSFQIPGKFKSVSSPIQTPDGGYVITGAGFIAKIDSSRKIAFQHTFGASGESVFATTDGGFFLFGDVTEGTVVSKLNSEGIVPGCNFFRSLGATTRTSFGPLRISGLNIFESNDLSFEPSDFGLTSVVANNPVTTLCQ